MPSRIPRDQKAKYHHLRFELGLTRAEAAREAGVSYSWAKSYDSGQANHGQAFQTRKLDLPGGVVPAGELCVEARRALDDFGFFRMRYFGVPSTPWQEEAAHRIAALLETVEREYVVINCPPGAGKSWLFSKHIPAWLTCRRRALRGMIGSRTQNQATRYTAQLRRELMRVRPFQADPDDIARGWMFDAAAAMVADFGPFKPENPEIWTREQFTVLQEGETPVDEKESTCSAFGMDSGFLGFRVDYIIWDDLVDKKTTVTAEAVEKQADWFDDEAETRLEPGGLLVLMGQRMKSGDLYRHCLDKGGAEELEGDPDALPESRQYHHIVYKAHYEDRCDGRHFAKHDPAPYPEGCLLDPVRLSWRHLSPLMRKGAKYRVLYQQEDVDPESVLVPLIWVKGGRDITTGFEYPGCEDRDRGLCELPKGLVGPLISVATADPSPTKYWGIEWWVYHPASNQRFLMDLERRALDAGDFLDWIEGSKAYVGLMNDWQERSERMGLAIRTWVVERNAAQRWLYAYNFVRRWQAQHKVQILAHDTNRNKVDPEFGVDMIASKYEYGQVRLPMKGEARIQSMKLIDEVTRYPDATTTDCLMAHWFFEHNLSKLERTPLDKQPKIWRPGWMRERSAA